MSVNGLFAILHLRTFKLFQIKITEIFCQSMPQRLKRPPFLWNILPKLTKLIWGATSYNAGLLLILFNKLPKMFNYWSWWAQNLLVCPFILSKTSRLWNVLPVDFFFFTQAPVSHIPYYSRCRVICNDSRPAVIYNGSGRA